LKKKVFLLYRFFFWIIVYSFFNPINHSYWYLIMVE